VRGCQPDEPTERIIYRKRHRPETTLLYQIIRANWPEFQAELVSQNSEVWQEQLQMPVIKSGEILEHLREKPLEKLRIQLTQ